jgi:signal transduction histidine kinase/ActR/RegA family two-component response regulator
MIRTRAHDLALALRHYVAGDEEAARLQAYEVARDAMAGGVGLLGVVADHQDALAIVLSGVWTPEESVRVVKAAAELLAESLGPFEMAHRGFQEANATLLRVNQELERRITERQRAEEAARLAREEADRANRAKSEFLSRMSHELRTPLNAVLGFGELLDMDDLTQEQRDSVHHILKGGRHLLDLINEVLDIARIESGRMALSLEPVSVREVLDEVLDLVRPLASEQYISLRSELDDGTDPFVLADRQRLKQVLLNLLSNAVKYNREGGKVTVLFEDRTDGRVRIAVTDEGQGIAPEQAARLFVPFERLGADLAGIQGTGLGLALSKGLVEAMGGLLRVESVPGAGSTFVVELPRTAKPQAIDEGVSPDVPSEAPASGGPRTLLYIEDNSANYQLIEKALGRRPELHLLWAVQGNLGVDLARQHQPDLVLLDLHLPDMSGEQVLRLLRDDPRTAQIPVVVLSADATPGQVGKLLAAGAVEYLTKPLQVRRFLEVVDHILEERSLGHAG